MGLALLLFCVTCNIASASLRRGDELAECSCDCCNTVRRLPDQSAAGVKVKCAPSNEHGSDVCTDECQAPSGDRLLSTRTSILDYQRYCFYECKPAEGPAAPVKTQCIPLDLQDIRKTEDHGHPRDPAIIYQKAKRKASLVSSRKGEPSIKDAKMEALRGFKQSAFEGKQAFEEAKVTRGLEAATASMMNEQLRDHLEKEEEEGEGASLGSKDPYAPIQDIRQMKVHASAAAEKAGEAAQAALAALKKARQLTWENAVDEAEAAIVNVKAQAEAKAKADAEHLKRISNTQEVKMAAAAAKAAEPFFISMVRAQQTAKDYQGRGEKNAGQARDLEVESQKLAKQANEDNAAGKAAIAQSEILESRKVMREAQSYAKQARQFFGTAKEIDKGIPKFAAAAQAASAKAAYDANPAWQR